MTDIKLVNVTKNYGDKTVLNNISLEIKAGERVCVTGESGVGKTTLLRIMTALEKPSAGAVETVSDISVVFQEDRLLPHLSALSNCLIVMPRGKPSVRRATDMLSDLGLSNIDMSKPARELSGGMARRACVARALLYESNAVFMDEPFKGLDGENRLRAIKTVNAHTIDKTLVIISHNTEDASALGANIYNMSEHSETGV